MSYEFSPELADATIGATPLTSTSSSALLDEILANCSDARLVFDLDSTLLNNRPRNAAIMREFAERESEPLLAQATADHFPDWSVRNSLALLGIETAAVERLLPRYEAFWGERFFTSEYCQYDIAVPGAVEFVCAVASAGGQVTYLTGRHEAMRAGSIESLVRLGFPDPSLAKSAAATNSAPASAPRSTPTSAASDGTELIMKAVFSESDDSYKEKALAQLQSGRRVAAAFDNEPTHINSYRRTFPEAVCVHLLTDHSMRNIPLLHGTFSILDFVRLNRSLFSD